MRKIKNLDAMPELFRVAVDEHGQFVAIAVRGAIPIEIASAPFDYDPTIHQEEGQVKITLATLLPAISKFIASEGF